MDNRLTEGRISTEILRFAIPFLFSSILQAVYSAVDVFVVGQFSGAASVSAVSIGSGIMSMITGIVLALSMGGTVLIGEKVGAKDYEGVGRGIGNLALLFLLIAIIMSPVMMLLTNTMVSLMQTPVEAVVEARQYVRICSFGLIFIVGYNGVSSIFRGLGDSKTPVYFVLIATIMNIILDFLFVKGFGMSAAGAAYATIIAQGFSFLASLIYMVVKGFAFEMHKSYFRPQKKYMAKILKVGIPLATQSFLVNISFLLISAMVNTLGVNASAAAGIGEKALNFAFLIPSSLSSAVATMVAQNNGAGKFERSWKCLWYGVGYGIIPGIVICIICNMFPNLLPSFFSNEPEVIRLAGEYIRFYSVDLILTPFIFCFNSFFSSCNRPMITFTHSIVSTVLGRIPATWYFRKFSTNHLTLMGLAAPIASMISIVMCVYYLKKVYEDVISRG